MNKHRIAAIFSVCFLCVAYIAVSQNVKAYIYDERGYAIPCLRPYLHHEIIDFTTLESGPIRKPADMFIDGSGYFYFADVGNQRVFKMSLDGRLELVIKDKKVMPRPAGLFVHPTTGDIYVADGQTTDILKFSPEGVLLKTYTKPSGDVIPEDFVYEPSKIVVDERNWIYILGTGAAKGIMTLDEFGEFRGYFGANPVTFNFARWLARLVASPEQKVRMLLQLLAPATNFVMDDKGFIYTVSETVETDQIKKLNVLGVNSYKSDSFGETRYEGKYSIKPPALSAIDVDDRGILTVLDGVSGKIFQYNQDGDLLFVFGGESDAIGFFRDARDVAVDDADGTLYVLDAGYGVLHVFKPTAFADLVFRATELYYKGDYQAALSVWDEITVLDANYPLAHKGIAKALTAMGRKYQDRDYHKAAMVHYKYAGDREGYSDAFKLYWGSIANEYFGLFIIIILLFIVGVWAFVRFLLPKLRRIQNPFLRELGAGISVLLHPFNQFERVKYSYSRLSVYASLGFVAAYFITNIVTLYGTSFHFATRDPGQINWLPELSRMLLPWLSWCVANYLITLILDGEGKFSQIFVFSSYCLVPYILISLITMGLSHILSLDNGATMTFLQNLMYVWMAVLFLLGVSIVHDYSMKGSVGVSLLSVVTVVLVWGVAVLLYGLVGSFFGFIIDIAREIGFHVYQ